MNCALKACGWRLEAPLWVFVIRLPSVTTAGELAVKVLKGESPAKMAFLAQQIDVSLNKKTAQEIGLRSPETVLKSANGVSN
jgi:ABC-type uncharacterized transport system substrate-binding protein